MSLVCYEKKNKHCVPPSKQHANKTKHVDALQCKKKKVGEGVELNAVSLWPDLKCMATRTKEISKGANTQSAP